MKISSLIALAVLAFAASTSTYAQQIKWHPGHYLRLNAGGSQAEHFRHIEEISRVPSIEGVELQVNWYGLERAKGDYNFSRIDAYLAKLRSLGTNKRLVVFIMDRRFGGTSRVGIVPDYLLNDPIYKGGVVQQSEPGFVARLWETPVMDRYIALYRALGNRYDDEPLLEGFRTAETVLTLRYKSTWPAGYSPETLLQQYIRFAQTARDTMPRTTVFLGTNYVGTDSQMGRLIQALRDNQMGAGGPGVLPNKLTEGQRVWTGVTGADYRGGLPIGTAVEANSLGGSKGDYTPRQIADHAYRTLGVTHLFWIRNVWTGTAAQQWSQGILPLLKTDPPLRTACPTNYGLCTR